MNILSQIVWSFQQEKYDNVNHFATEIENYQNEILGERSVWQQDAIAIDAPEVEICYEAWITGPEAILANEELIADEEDAFDEDNSDEGLFQVELCAKLRASNGANFTALDLLYQLEKQMSNKDLGDHVYFEGLTLHEQPESANSVPIYYLNCGS